MIGARCGVHILSIWEAEADEYLEFQATLVYRVGSRRARAAKKEQTRMNDVGIPHGS